MTRELEPGYRREPQSGIYLPQIPVAHCDEAYDPRTFAILLQMQQRHFWYRGRHRFLLHCLRRVAPAPAGLHAIDLGGGCGGWIDFLQRHAAERFAELALGDSSLQSLQLAGAVVGPDVKRFQLDLRRLPWTDRWDVTFLLDVLEHLADDGHVMRQVATSLRPGGIAVVSTPALDFFWSSNDELVHHVRRYSRQRFQELARVARLDLVLCRYFMFFLSPLLVARRWRRTDVSRLTDAEKQQRIAREHRIPAPWLNAALAAVFAAESPLGVRIPFPWGTSIVGVFCKR